jgi:isopenicillin-N epimerase
MNNATTFKPQFLLRPDITFLNFGSFGACPKPVFDDYQHWQLMLEREPIQFFAFQSAENLKKSREALSSFVHCHSDDIVFMSNPTTAINTIANSFPLNKGDEILTTDLEYGAMDRTWQYYCDKNGASYIRQHISLPLVSKEIFIKQFWEGYTPNTKAIFISQITSSTALKLPVEEICLEAKQRGLITIVDGAHVPAQMPLNLNQLNADIYTGACHKWMMAPKGCSFLYVAKHMQNLINPLIVSWGYKSAAPSHSQFLDYHQMNGTRDLAPYFTLPRAIQFMNDNNWTEVSANCRKLAQSNYHRFCTLLGSVPNCPISDEFLGQMCSIAVRTSAPEQLQRLLYDKYKIELPVMRHDKAVYMRYSIQAFNSPSDLDVLYNALAEIIDTTDLITI